MPEPHELETVYFLVEHLPIRHVRILAPSQVEGVHKPDLDIDGVLWEMKAPINSNKRSVEHILRVAIKQSVNILIDLRRLNGSESNFVSRVKFELGKRKNIKKLKIITKDLKLLT